MDIFRGREKLQYRMDESSFSNRNWGMTGIPIVLILSVFLAAIAIGLGTKSLNRFSSLSGKQRSTRSFDEFFETVTEVGYGRIGETEQVCLELDGGRIIVEGSLVRLEKDNEIFRSEYLSLPLRKLGRDNFNLRSGNFSIELMGSDQSLSKDNVREIFLHVIRS